MRTIFPVLVVTLGFAAVACSGDDEKPKVTVAKDVATTKHTVKTGTETATYEFACAAVVNSDQTTVTVPTAIFDKAKSSVKVGTLLLIKGVTGNKTNSSGLLFRVSGISASTDGKSVVLKGAAESPEAGFSEMEFDTSVTLSNGSQPAEECKDGVYVGPGNATDPAVPASGESSSDLPAASAGVRYEIEPQVLFEQSIEAVGTDGSKIKGKAKATLDAAYFGLLGKFETSGGILKGYYRADLKATLDAKVQATLAVTLDSTTIKPKKDGIPVKFEKEIDLGVPEKKISVPWGNIEYKQQLLIRCVATGSEPFEVQAGAQAQGEAGVFAKVQISSPNFDYTGRDGAPWQPELTAGPIFNKKVGSGFQGKCEGEVRVKFKLLGRNRSYVAARVFVDVDDKAACPVAGGLAADVHLDPPVLKNFDKTYEVRYGADGGKCSLSAGEVDICKDQPDGWRCDQSKDITGALRSPSHAYLCTGGKLSDDAYCDNDELTCKSVTPPATSGGKATVSCAAN